MTFPARNWLLAACLAGAALAVAVAQAPTPVPAKYKVTLRYDIPSPRDHHVEAYDSLISYLQRLKFDFIPPLEKHPDSDREDLAKNYLQGTIDADKALKLLDHPTVGNILLVPLAPEEFKLPEEPNDPVAVRLELAGNLTPERQRELANQTRVLLGALGFKEAVGYDRRGYTSRLHTRIVGTIPKAKLDLLQRDLRRQPAGWLAPLIPPDELPSPLNGIDPIRVVEVLPDTAAIKEPAEPEARLPEFLEKISPDLWELLKGKETPTTPTRVQVVFIGDVAPDDSDWKRALQELAPSFFIESQFGSFVTGIISLDQVKALASSPIISVIRLPRVPAVDVDPAFKIKGDNAKALAQTGLKELHKRGYRGKGVRIGVIDRDFRGWEALVKAGQLPPKTRIVDLTIELNSEVYPVPYAGDANQPGHGALCAQAAALAAPEAELVLIRTPAADPHQLYDVVRYVRGGRFSRLVERQNGELIARTAQLNARRADLLRERAEILNDFTDETDLHDTYGFLGPFFGWLYSKREWHRERMIYQEKLEDEQHAREDRFSRFMKDIESLRDIPIVVNAVGWNSGYPLGSGSPLSRALDDSRQSPLWFQAAGNTAKQAWLAPFRTSPADTVMKFAAPDAPLPKGRWSRELNFLAWQPHDGPQKPDLPEKTKLRITLQWREPHNPAYYLRPDEEDYYRTPLANLRLQLLRQRDPEAKALPADAFDLVARTAGWPERLQYLPTTSIYEHVLEVPLEKGGHYALRLEKQASTQWLLVPHPERKTPMFRLIDGLTPTGLSPLGMPALPELGQDWELRPRLFVEVIDNATRLQGRAVLADFATEVGVIGLPADARNVISVGAASFKNEPQPASAYGTPMQMELSLRPSVYAYDELELAGGGALGTSIANAFAAGITAAYQSSGVKLSDVQRWLRTQTGQVLRVPSAKKGL